jgi:hypothetical protein
VQERTTTSSPRAAMAVAIVCTAMITAVMGLQASFHRVLEQRLVLGDAHPRLAQWIGRVDRRPRA